MQAVLIEKCYRGMGRDPVILIFSGYRVSAGAAYFNGGINENRKIFR